ncbi:MAG: YkgJ family cysteine cluster protein [Thermodesulfobacteriota bacterium]
MPTDFASLLTKEAEAIVQEVGATVDARTLVNAVLSELPRSGDGRWILARARELLIKAAYATRPYCIRCGKCCMSGSPTLLHDDLALFGRGVLKPEHLVTIRSGEPAYFNVTEEVGACGAEMLKIRETAGTRTCIFFAPPGTCTIHDSRPVQCALQECWNPEKAQENAHARRLTRRDLLEDAGEFLSIIERHEQRCSYHELLRAIARLRATKGQTVTELIELLKFDEYVRSFVVERLGLDREHLGFFFGRPLSESLDLYGLRLAKQPDGSFFLTTAESGDTSRER